jgi:hypothetical protein
MSSANQYLKPLLDNVFSKIRTRVAEIEREEGNRERITQDICNYVSNTIAAESRSLVSSLYTKLLEETFSKEPFLTTRNKNKFYEKDIWSMIYDKYSFSTQEKINYEQASKNIASLLVPATALGLGVVLSIALSKVIIILIALVVSGCLYYFILKNKKTTNKDDFAQAIGAYLDSVKRELLVWFENIERFYYEQLEEIKATLKD